MGKGLEYLFKLIFALNNTDPDMDRQWKRIVGLVTTGLVVLVVVAVVLLRGWLPTVAMAKDLTGVEDRLNAKQQTLGDRFDRLALLGVKSAFRNALHDRCAASRAKNQAALDAANSSLDDLSDQFRALAKYDPPMPDCKVVLIDGPPQ